MKNTLLLQYFKFLFILLVLVGGLVILRLYQPAKEEIYVAKQKLVSSVRSVTRVISTVTTPLYSRTRPASYPKNGTGHHMDIFLSSKTSRSVQNSICKGINITLVVPVYSAPHNFERRRAIRQTYAKSCKSLKQGCTLFFIIGVSSNYTINEKVLFEYENEADILFIDKVDTYRDLNNKAAVMIDWVDTFCSSASYVLHVIDDVYPNIQLFMNILGSIQRKDYILGYVVPSLPPQRSGKFIVTNEEYPYENFPAYVTGTAYALPMSTVRRIKAVLYSAIYCWIEDVWLNGMVREQAGVDAVSLNQAFQEYPDLKANFSNTPYYHHVDIKDFHELYKIEQNQNSQTA